jgi:hypothetical protein
MYINSQSFVGQVEMLSIQNLTVEPTKEILNVNAFSGTARNVLSGDVTGIELTENGDVEAAVTTIQGNNIDVYNLTIERSTEKPRRGSYGWKNTAGASIGAFRFDSGQIPSGKYRFSCWVYRPASIGDRIYMWINDNDLRIEDYTPDEWVYIQEDIDYDNTKRLFDIRINNTVSGDVWYLDDISLMEIIPEVINTNIEIVKDGHIRTPELAVSGAVIKCGDYHDLTGDITLLSWYNVYDQRLGTSGRVIDNGQLLLRQNANAINYWTFSSDAGVTNGNSGTGGGYYEYGEFAFIAITRKVDGTCNFWINGEKQGTADQNSGTPAAGTTDIAVGAVAAGSNQISGKLPEVRVIDGLLTSEEISQYYTATKHLYGK